MKKWLVAFLVLILGIPAQAEEPDGLYALSAVLLDGESGRVLFEKNGSDVKAMASTTKIMTCILALENGDEQAEVSFSGQACSQPKVRLGASAGETFYLKDLLYSLMLESHNDTAVAIAEAVSGSVGAFAEQMNQKADEIGCRNTYFITPNGLDASDERGVHSTTARDLARMMRYCIMESPKKERFLEITSTPQYSFSDREGKKTFSCTNHNAFLTMMDEAITGKTGFTANAGYCYVGAVRSEGRTFIVSLLGCGWPNHKTYKWSDMKKLVSYGMENYRFRTIEAAPALKEVTVQNGIPRSGSLFETAKTGVEIEKDEELTLLMNQQEEIEIRTEQKETLPAPIKAGDIAGEAVCLLNGEVVARYPIRCTQAVREKTAAWTFRRILELYVRWPAY